jgi:hypothetical protein
MRQPSKLLCATVFVLGGCGPLQMPMAPRFEPEQLQQIDAAWDKALSPVDQLDRSRWLDLFVGARAYQAGVDKLSMHSEKRFAGGLVVMEVLFDRANPENDHFRVEVRDLTGQLIREETYGRDEVQATYEYLFVHHPPEPKGEEPTETTKKRAEFEARWKGIAEYFPESKDRPKPK